MTSPVRGRSRAVARVDDSFTAPEVALLREKEPEIYRQFIKAKQVQWRHERRLASADLLAQVIGNLSGLVALVLLTAIAWHAIDRGDATQGASIICTGAVSIVAVFVTGRLTSGDKRGKTDKNKQGNKT
jgi:hypothetical protein